MMTAAIPSERNGTAETVFLTVTVIPCWVYLFIYLFLSFTC